jgi:hypothetical protein
MISSFSMAYADDIHPGRPFLLHKAIKKLKDSQGSDSSQSDTIKPTDTQNNSLQSTDTLKNSS